MTTPDPEATRPAIPDHELVRCIGRGSYGEVWLARNIMGNYRAVKIVYRKTFENDRPFEREFKGIQKFEPISRSDNSQVNILHVGRNQDCFYYVMELADDQTHGQQIDPDTYAAKTLSSEMRQRGRLPFSECLEIGLALTAALAHLHQNGLVHRDVKPSNVILVNGIPKLADIGLVTDSAATMSYVGTEGFLPPEGPGTPQADIYSLGKVLYEISTGKDRKAFPEPPTLLGEFVDREEYLELSAIIARACESNVNKRYATAEAMQADLLLLKTGKSVRRTQKLERRLALLARTSVVGLAIVVLTAAGWVYERVQTQKARDNSQREESLRQKAEVERGRADQERQRALQLSESLRQNLYAATIAQAHGALEDGEAERALALLDGVGPGQDGEDLRGFEWFYLKGLCHREKYTLRGHVGRVMGVAFSPDGKILASAGDNGAVRLWDMGTGREKADLIGHEDCVNCVAFAPDGKTLVTGSADRTLRLWDADSGKETRVLRGHLDSISAVAFSPDGKLLASATSEAVCGTGNPQQRYMASWRPGELKLWDLGTHHERYTLHGPKFGFLSLAFSPDGKTLAAGSGDSRVTFWDVAQGKEIRRLTNFFGSIFALAWDPNGKGVAIGGGLGWLKAELKLWTGDANEMLPFLDMPELPVSSLAFSADGQTLATGGLDRIARLWDVGSRRERTRFLGHSNVVWSAALSANGDLLATGGWDGSVKVWNARQGQRCDYLQGPASENYSVSFSPDGKLIAAASRTVTIVDVASAKQLRVLPDYSGDSDVLVRYSPDGKYLAAAGNMGRIQLWRVSDWAHTEMVGCQEIIWQLAFSPNSKLLASAYNNGTVELWDVATGTRSAVLKGHSSSVRDLAFTPDGETLLSSSWNEMYAWDVAAKKRNFTLPEPASCFCISPDGHWLATEYSNTSIVLRDLATMRVIHTISGHKDLIWAMRFSPDSKTLATSSWDGTAKLWQVATGQELLSFPSASGGGWELAFSPDNRTLAIGSGSRMKVELAFLRAFHDAPATNPGNLAMALRSSEPQENFPMQKVKLAQFIPARSLQTSSNLIDLSRYYNASLTRGWLPPAEYATSAERNFVNLPLGVSKFAGVEFDVRGLIQLNGGALRFLDNTYYPDIIRGIKVGLACHRLHFLHGTAWQGHYKARVATIYVRYTGGRHEVFGFDYGPEGTDWSYDPSGPLPELGKNTVVAWTGKNAHGLIHVFKTVWENPNPDLKIESIEVEAPYDTSSCPFLIAVTGE